MEISRCNIYMADLRDCIDKRYSAYRPVVVVQNDVGNEHSDTVIVAFVTSKDKKPLPTHVTIGEECGVRDGSIVMCEQLFTVRKDLLVKYVGSVTEQKSVDQLNKCLSVSLGILHNIKSIKCSTD